MIIQLKTDFMRGSIPPVSPTNGVFICGGAVRRWFSGKEKLSDIDVFAPTPQHHQDFLATLGKVQLLVETTNATTYEWEDKTIQLIKFYYPTLEAAIDSFDFNICQFGWTEEGVFATPEAIVGVLRNHLSVNKINPGFEADSLRRAFKYQLKGFIPCAGTIRDLAMSFTGLEPAQIQAQIEMSPKGGKRLIRFD